MKFEILRKNIIINEFWKDNFFIQAYLFLLSVIFERSIVIYCITHALLCNGMNNLPLLNKTERMLYKMNKHNQAINYAIFFTIKLC